MAETIPNLMIEITGTYPDHVAQYSKDENEEFRPTTFAGLKDEVFRFAAGLADLGVERGNHVGLISDNRKEWFITDLAVLCLGAADVPRGCDSSADEIAYILGFPECRTAVLENAQQLSKVFEKESEVPDLKQIILLEEGEERPDTGKRFKILTFSEIMALGSKRLEKEPDCIAGEIEKGAGNDCATIIFTSGTTGKPKGVMLSHRNFLHQVECVPLLITVGPGDRWQSILPVWHSFERIMQYVALGTASSLGYSKLIARILTADFQKLKPTWMAAVPRVWESLQAGIYRAIRSQGVAKTILFRFFVAVGSAHKSAGDLVKGLVPQFKRRIRLLDIVVGIVPYILLYPLKALGNALVFGKIRQRLGGEFVAGISGGGALPAAVDKFYGAAGILLLEGYGLTETAPVLSFRLQRRPVPGTIGPIFPGTEARIVDEEGKELPPGRKGVLHVRGPQVMLGYYRQPDLTKEILSEDGWLNTGDLAMITHRGEIKIVGRAKDTIVLLGGENIEPSPIEEKITESQYISTAVVLGQDQKFLAALIVPDREAVTGYAEENNVSYTNEGELVENPAIMDLIRSEINDRVSARNGFKTFERIFRFKILDTELEVGRELSAKQEIKRHVISELYKKEIKELFA